MALTKAHNRMIAGAQVNVLDFGAVGDGVTDDTAAIQAAIDAVAAKNGGEVYFPSIGSSVFYKVSDTIKITGANIRLKGDSPSATQIRLADNSNVDLLECDAPGSGYDNVFITGIHFNGNKSNNTSGNVAVLKGLQASSSISNCLFSQAAENGVVIGRNTSNTANSTVVEIINCDIIGADGIGLVIDGALSVFVTDSSIQFCGDTHCTIANTQALDEPAFMFNGVHFEQSSSTTSSGYGIVLTGGASNTKAINVGLINCTFRATAIPATPIRIASTYVNLVCANVSKTGWGQILSNIDSDRSVSGSDVLTLYVYGGGVATTHLDNVNVFDGFTLVGSGTVDLETSGGGAWKLRRSNYCNLEIGESDADTWRLQDNNDNLNIERFISGVGTTMVRFSGTIPTSGKTALYIYDADNATLEQVSVGASDSGGTGYKVLRIPN